MVNELATLGDDPNHLNEFGEAPLCVAAYKAQGMVVEELLQKENIRGSFCNGSLIKKRLPIAVPQPLLPHSSQMPFQWLGPESVIILIIVKFGKQAPLDSTKNICSS